MVLALLLNFPGCDNNSPDNNQPAPNGVVYHSNVGDNHIFVGIFTPNETRSTLPRDGDSFAVAVGTLQANGNLNYNVVSNGTVTTGAEGAITLRPSNTAHSTASGRWTSSSLELDRVPGTTHTAITFSVSRSNVVANPDNPFGSAGPSIPSSGGDGGNEGGGNTSGGGGGGNTPPTATRDFDPGKIPVTITVVRDPSFLRTQVGAGQNREHFFEGDAVHLNLANTGIQVRVVYNDGSDELISAANVGSRFVFFPPDFRRHSSCTHNVDEDCSQGLTIGSPGCRTVHTMFYKNMFTNATTTNISPQFLGPRSVKGPDNTALLEQHNLVENFWHITSIVDPPAPHSLTHWYEDWKVFHHTGTGSTIHVNYANANPNVHSNAAQHSRTNPVTYTLDIYNTVTPLAPRPDSTTLNVQVGRHHVPITVGIVHAVQSISIQTAPRFTTHQVLFDDPRLVVAAGGLQRHQVNAHWLNRLRNPASSITVTYSGGITRNIPMLTAYNNNAFAPGKGPHSFIIPPTNLSGARTSLAFSYYGAPEIAIEVPVFDTLVRNGVVALRRPDGPGLVMHANLGSSTDAIDQQFYDITQIYAVYQIGRSGDTVRRTDVHRQAIGTFNGRPPSASDLHNSSIRGGVSTLDHGLNQQVLQSIADSYSPNRSRLSRVTVTFTTSVAGGAEPPQVQSSNIEIGALGRFH
jgi:hypothetical protein